MSDHRFFRRRRGQQRSEGVPRAHDPVASERVAGNARSASGNGRTNGYGNGRANGNGSTGRPIPVFSPRGRAARPDRLPTATVARSEPGAPWWSYRRPELPGLVATKVPAPAPADSSEVPAPVTSRPGLESIATRQSGVVPGAIAFLLLVLAYANGQWIEVPTLGRVAVAGAAICAAAAAGPALVRRHPEEPWLAQLLVWGVVFKLLASLARYFTLVDGYGGVGDATEYHEFGVEYVQGIAAPLDDLRKTNFVRWTTGNLYDLVGPDMMTGFFVYGLVAFVGAYLWYRAAAIAVPSLNRRWYCMFMFFLPSIAFWPSSIGKEALMQAGIGCAALGTAHLLNGRVLRGTLIALPGGYLMWAIRPHLLAMVTLAAGAAYLVGRGRREHQSMSLMRPIGMVLVAMLCVFAIAQAMTFLGMKDVSIDSIEAELNEQTGRTAQGGSEIKNVNQVSLTPLSVPQGAITVLLRPFVWEVESGFQILASLEVAAITAFLLQRFTSLTYSLRQSRRQPFLFYCWTLLALYSVAFSAFANMGLLVRQRSLVLPALFALLCVQVARTAADPPPVDTPGTDGRVAG